MKKETIQGHIVRGYDFFDIVQDCTPVNKPIPCKMIVERLSGHAERLIMSRE